MTTTVGALVFAAAISTTSIASAIDWSAYSHDADIGYRNHSWMSQLPDERTISQISMVGTHDSMSLYGGDSVQTQSMSLESQLNAGVRALDIRCRHYYNTCEIHHGFVYQNANLDDVFSTVERFLSANRTETVLMRVKEEYEPVRNSRSFEDTFASYVQRHPGLLWNPTNSNPTLGEVRGKVVVLQNFSGYKAWGISYNTLDIQDRYQVATNWDLYTKWTNVKEQLARASSGRSSTIFMNYLSAAVGSFPYFVASGNSSPQTGAPLLATGLFTPGSNAAFPDFPRTRCVFGMCTIAFEGTNRLASERLAGTTYGRVGVVMADFPGADLIRNVIGHNAFVESYRPLSDGRSGLCLDVNGSNTANGSAVTLWTCHGGANQKWKYDPANGYLRSALNPNKCLDNRGQAFDGGGIGLWDCVDSNNLRFDWVGNTLRSRINGNIAVDAFGAHAGARVGQWTYHGGANQQWTWGR